MENKMLNGNHGKCGGLWRLTAAAVLLLGFLVYSALEAGAEPINRPEACKDKDVPDGAFTCELTRGNKTVCAPSGDYMCCKPDGKGGWECDQIEAKTSDPKRRFKFTAPAGALQKSPVATKQTNTNPTKTTGVTSAKPSVSAGAKLQPKSPGGVVRASTQLNCANGKSFEVNTGNKNGSCSVKTVDGKAVSAGCSDVGGSGAGANVNTAEASCATGCGSTSGSGSCKAVN